MPYIVHFQCRCVYLIYSSDVNLGRKCPYGRDIWAKRSMLRLMVRPRSSSISIPSRLHRISVLSDAIPLGRLTVIVLPSACVSTHVGRELARAYVAAVREQTIQPTLRNPDQIIGSASNARRKAHRKLRRSRRGIGGRKTCPTRLIDARNLGIRALLTYEFKMALQTAVSCAFKSCY